MNQNHVSKVMPKQAAESNIGGIINNMLEQEHQSAEECAGVVITDEMIQEEINLENQVIAEEKRLQEKILDDEKKRNEEQCFKRLHLLLSKSSIYAKFMAEKLQKHEQAEKKKEIKEQRKLKSLNDDKRLNDISLKRSKTAKGGNKKIKCNMIDIYKKENMASMEFQECNDKNQKASADYTNYEHPKLFSGGTMRGYQIEGYEWLITLFENGVNGILADEMGLGKTIQCIAFIANMIEKGLDGPFLICGPLSTLPNWVSEFKRFTPDIPVILYHGQKADRKILRENIFKRVKCSGVMCHPVVITSFQIALIDCSKLRSIRWKLLAVDEAHRIKNFQCKLVMALKRFNCVHRLLLTGTPLQNDLSELWSLLNFILPEIFDDLNVFRSWFDISRLKSNGATAEIVAQEKEKQIVSTIHEILNPFLLRRTKADVQLQLPPKKEVIVPAPLSRLQQKYYADVLNKKIQKSLEKNEFTEVGQKRIRKSINYCELGSDDDFSDTQENVVNIRDIVPVKEICHTSKSSPYFDTTSNHVYVNIRNRVMLLRKICCHPYLLSYPLSHELEYKIDEKLVKSSGKLMMLDIMLSELKKRGHKVLIFSQFVCMLEILQDYCFLRGHKYNILYGSMRLSNREKEISEFNNDPNSFLFLISTKAGGLGINLIAADTVIIYDSDWNPQSDLQAQDRCHRIGQDKPVIVYRLVIPNTVDEYMVSTADSKRKLEKAIIKKGRFASKDFLNRATGRLTIEEMIEILESSDVTKFKEFDENNIISPEDLNKLLDRSHMILSSEDMKK